MEIFDIRRPGGEEIVEAVGLIDRDVDYEKWRPLVPLGAKAVAAIVGRETVEAIAEHYASSHPDEGLDRLAAMLQQAVALFTWTRIIPTLDAQHGNAGRGHRTGENEKGMTALEQEKDESNILSLAYEAVDTLIEELDRQQPDFWTRSTKYLQREGLLIRTKETFDDYYHTGSARLFVTLLPMIRETQENEIAPIAGAEVMAAMLADSPDMGLMTATARRALALLTMKKAVERLPIEVIPEGIVQVNMSQPVRSRLRAEKEARNSVAHSLGEAGALSLSKLEGLVAAYNSATAEIDRHIPGGIVHSKGMTF